MNDISSQKEEEKHNETSAVLREINEVMAQPYFNDYRGNLADEGRFQMLPAGELA